MTDLDGSERAIQAFREEEDARTHGMPHALHALKTCFTRPGDQGPMACAAFRLTNRHLDPDWQEESEQIYPQCVALAEGLLS